MQLRISLLAVLDRTGECKVLIIDYDKVIPTYLIYISHGSILDHHHYLEACDYSAI